VGSGSLLGLRFCVRILARISARALRTAVLCSCCTGKVQAKCTLCGDCSAAALCIIPPLFGPLPPICACMPAAGGLHPGHARRHCHCQGRAGALAAAVDNDDMVHDSWCPCPCFWTVLVLLPAGPTLCWGSVNPGSLLLTLCNANKWGKLGAWVPRTLCLHPQPHAVLVPSGARGACALHTARPLLPAMCALPRPFCLWSASTARRHGVLHAEDV